MRSMEEVAVGLKRKRMTAWSFKASFRNPQKKRASGDAEVENAKKASNSCSSNDNSKDGLMKKRINRESGPAFVQDGDHQPAQLAVAVSNSDKVCDRSQQFRRDSMIDEVSSCSLSGLESFASVSVSEDRASSSVQMNLNDLPQGAPIGSQEEFHKIWEKERCRLEEDHKLEVALIRLIYGHGGIANGKLAHLEKTFSDKLEKHNLLKKQRIEELAMEQLAASENVAASLQQNPDAVPPEGSSGLLVKGVNDDNRVEPDAESDAENNGALNEDLGRQRNEIDLIADGGLQNFGEASPDSQPMVQRQESGELQIQTAPPAEIQSMSEREVITSAMVDNAGSKSPSLQVPLNDGVEAPISSVDARLVSETSEQAQPILANLTCGENLSGDELLDQGASAPQIAESIRREELPEESLSSNLGNLQVPMGCNRQAACDGAPAQPPQVTSVLLDTIAAPRDVSAVGIQNEPPPSMGIALNHSVQSPIWNSTQPSPAGLFHYSIQKILSDAADLEKNHRDMMSKVKSDCERELSEMLVQVRRKYGLKLEEAEAEFKRKRDELNRNQKKIIASQMLAEALRSKGPVPCVLQQHHLPYPPSLTPQHGSSGGSAAPGHGAVSARPGAVLHGVALPSTSASRPSILNTAGPPAYFPGNSGEIPTARSSTVPAVTLNPVNYSPSPLQLRQPHITLQGISSFISQPSPILGGGYLPPTVLPSAASGHQPQGAANPLLPQHLSGQPHPMQPP